MMSNIDNIENLIFNLKSYEMELLQIQSENFQEINVSDNFEVRINRLIKKLKMHNRLLEMRRIAIAIFITTILLTAILRPQMYVEAARKLFEEFSDHFHVQFKESIDGRIPDYELTYIPKGYKLKEEYDFNGMGAMVLYEKDSGKTITFDYEISDSSININNEGVIYHEYVDDRGRKIYYLEKTTAESSSMTWLSEDEKVVFLLFADENRDEMQKIVDGIKEKK